MYVALAWYSPGERWNRTSEIDTVGNRSSITCWGPRYLVRCWMEKSKKIKRNNTNETRKQSGPTRHIIKISISATVLTNEPLSALFSIVVIIYLYVRFLLLLVLSWFLYIFFGPRGINQRVVTWFEQKKVTDFNSSYTFPSVLQNGNFTQ